jgi:hypothetical protein
MLLGHPDACIHYDPAVTHVKCSADWGVLVFLVYHPLHPVPPWLPCCLLAYNNYPQPRYIPLSQLLNMLVQQVMNIIAIDWANDDKLVGRAGGAIESQGLCNKV